MAAYLMPFTGGLRNIAHEILSILTYYHSFSSPTDDSGGVIVCDPFVGSGSISCAARDFGYTVYAGDLALRSSVLAEALLLSEKEIPAWRIPQLLHEHADQDDFETLPKLLEHFVPPVLRVARRVYHNAQTPAEVYLAVRMLLSLAPKTIYSLARVDAEDETSMEAQAKSLRLAEDPAPQLDKLRKAVNSGIVRGDKREHKAGQFDAFDLIAAANTAGAGMLHLDPPTYGNKGYLNAYWWVDWFLGDEVVETGTQVTKKGALEFTSQCVGTAPDVPVVAITQQDISYGHEEATEVLESHGRVVNLFELDSNTKNPFYIAVGVKHD